MIKNIVITHGYSDSNKGDLAITQATVDSLFNCFPGSKITLMSSFRESDPDFWYHNRKMKSNDISIIQGIMPTPYTGGNSSFFANVLAVIRIVFDFIQTRLFLKIPFLGKLLSNNHYKAILVMKNADLIVVKGGQFIYNDKEDLRGNVFLWRTLQPIWVAHKLKKKIVVLSQSIGGFASEKSEKYAMKYLSLCDKVIVREQLSFTLLKKYQIKNIDLQPDMAFNIHLKNIENIFKIDKEILGVTVVNWSFPESKSPKKTRQQYVNNLFHVIKKASEELNLFPVFVPQVTVKHHGKSDLDLIRELTAKMDRFEIKYQVVSDDYDASQMASLYSKCSILIGTRLHSCILSAVAATPVIAIRYQGFKTQGVMKMLGFENYVHDIYNLLVEDLFNDVREVLENKESLENQLRRKVKHLKAEIELALSSLKIK